MAEIAIRRIFDKQLAKVLKKSSHIFWSGSDRDDPVPRFVSNNHFIFAITEAHEQTRTVALKRGTPNPVLSARFAQIAAESKQLYAQTELYWMEPTEWMYDFDGNILRLFYGDNDKVMIINEAYLKPLDDVTYRLWRGEYEALVAFERGWDEAPVAVILPFDLRMFDFEPLRALLEVEF